MDNILLQNVCILETFITLHEVNKTTSFYIIHDKIILSDAALLA